MLLLDIFKFDANFIENDEKYKQIKAEILGEESDEDDSEEEEEEEEEQEGEGIFLNRENNKSLTG